MTHEGWHLPPQTMRGKPKPPCGGPKGRLPCPYPCEWGDQAFKVRVRKPSEPHWESKFLGGRTVFGVRLKFVIYFPVLDKS